MTAAPAGRAGNAPRDDPAAADGIPPTAGHVPPTTDGTPPTADSVPPAAGAPTTGTSLTPTTSPGFVFWRITLAWQRQVGAALAPHGLTHVQFVLLACLAWLEEHGPGAPTQRELAAFAGTDPMMTSTVARTLEQRELVVRLVDPADARARRLTVTAAGRALARTAVAAVEAADRDFFGPVADLPRLLDLLRGVDPHAARGDPQPPAPQPPGVATEP